MAYDYEKVKSLYEGMSDQQKKQFATNYTGGYVQDFLDRYNAEKNQTSTPTSTTPTSIKPTNNSNATKVSSNTTSTGSNLDNYYKDNYYKDSDGYYSATERNMATGGAEFGGLNRQTSTPTSTPTTTTTRNDNVAKGVRDAWDAKTYEQQQELLKNNPGLKDAITQAGGTFKTPNSNVTPTTPTNNNQNKTPNGQWDFQDTSDSRMYEIAGHLNDYKVTNPELFDDWDRFYNFFIAGNNRSPEQVKYLQDYFNAQQRYNSLDNMTSGNVGSMMARGEVPEDYLNYVKYANPQRYADIMDAKDKSEQSIANESYLNTVASQAGFDMGDSNWWKWNQTEMGYRDENNDGLDDRLYHEPTEEELKLVEENNQYEQERAKLNDAMKWLQEDLTNQYPDADLSTIMLLTSDRGNKIQRALDTLAVSQTKVQGSLKYLQNERATMDDAGQKTINELQKQYGMYYDYSPQGIAEKAQAQYAATNVTLDQADNGTDTQKQMALDRVLSDYYDKYGSIIQRSKSQVINDVMNYAKKNGVSLSQALEDNFLKFLRQKPGFTQLSSYSGGNPDVFKIGEDTYGYWDENGNLIPIGSNIVGTGVGTMRTERNNNPTAMTTDVAKSLGGVEGVDYVQGDPFQTADGRTLYTAKLLGDPIETTIKLLDSAASTGRGAFYTKGGAQRWSHTAMSDAEWMKLTPEQKQSVVLQMLQREGGDINKMAGYNQGGEGTNGGELYNPQLAQIFKQWGDKPDTATAVKDFWNTYGDAIAAAGVSKEDFLKQYDARYEEQSADAYLEILAHLDQLIELTGGEYDLGERWQSLFGYGDAGRAYDYVKNNLTVNGLRDAKEQGLKLGVLSDSDVKMIGNAATTLSFTQGQKSWNRELNDFREKLLSKNKYLRQRYQNTSAYSPNTSINFSNTDRKFTIGEQNNNNTTKKAKSIKTLGA